MVSHDTQNKSKILTVIYHKTVAPLSYSPIFPITYFFSQQLHPPYFSTMPRLFLSQDHWVFCHFLYLYHYSSKNTFTVPSFTVCENHTSLINLSKEKNYSSLFSPLPWYFLHNDYLLLIYIFFSLCLFSVCPTRISPP